MLNAKLQEKRIDLGTRHNSLQSDAAVDMPPGKVAVVITKNDISQT
jgi:hypothetical protein